MSVENGEWIIKGLSFQDPECIRSPEELVKYIKKVGFLPLFGNEVPGFSVEEHTWSGGWWSGDPKSDPWEWREQIARGREVAYGKFFDKKAGFLSLEWLPYFANYRRNGYDFDALYEDGYASRRSKKIMDLFMKPEGAEAADAQGTESGDALEPDEGSGAESETGYGQADEVNGGMWRQERILSTDLKKMAGFGKGGEKNFPGILTDLQMQLYLVMIDFQRRRNKKGQEYGMPVSILLPPEAVWGYETVTKAYKEAPEESGQRIERRIRELYPEADEKAILKMLRK